MSAVVVVGVVLVAVIAVIALGRRPTGDKTTDEDAQTLRRTAVRLGRPDDGTPLTFDEQRALSDVEMDSLITIPEPVYGPRAERGKA